ncbi:MAG: hypothetical protein LBS21_11935 [Clostridiales bacterium]|jgi:flagellin|nr:hypothetical protein [Clostridiales bacterium]
MSNAVVNTNIEALNTHRNLKGVGVDAIKAAARLSGGLRINSAADDAAGLAISEKMRSQIRGLQQAERNVDDGINLIKTAEGGMSEITGMLNRQRELVIQGMNDTNTSDDRRNIQKELDQLTEEIASMANRTEYNTIPLLNVPKSYTVNDNTVITGISNFLINLGIKPMNSDGTLNLLAGNSSGTDSSIMIFGSGSTSYNKVEINGTTYDVRSEFEFNGVTEDAATQTWKVSYSFPRDSAEPEISLVQSVQIVKINGNEYYDITNTVTNNGDTDIECGFLFNVDAMFSGGAGDNPSFSLDGMATRITTGTILNGINLPSEVDVYDVTYPIINARIILKNPGEGIDPAPDSLYISQWGGQTGNSVTFDNYLGSETIRDSAYSVIWRDKTIAGGDSMSFKTFYGVTDPRENPELPIATKGGDLWIQSGANENQGVWVDRYDCRPTALGIDYIVTEPFEEAERSLSKLDKALDKLNANRANAGAQQNRLEYISKAVAYSAENLQASESRIRDADMAKEMMNLTKANVLNQAGIAMLTQNARGPERVLALLRQ